MNLGKIFGATFFSVIAAMIAYDLIVKNLVSGVLPSGKYDDTFDSLNPVGKKSGCEYFIQDGKVYRIKSAA